MATGTFKLDLQEWQKQKEWRKKLNVMFWCEPKDVTKVDSVSRLLTENFATMIQLQVCFLNDHKRSPTTESEGKKYFPSILNYLENHNS